MPVPPQTTYAFTTFRALAPRIIPSYTSLRPTDHHIIVRSPMSVVPHGMGQDAVDSWLDLSGFVATATSSAHTPFDELADRIGRDCYIDVAGWHLYLKDVKVGGATSMAQGIAQQAGALVLGQGFNSGDIEQFLSKVPVKMGQGKVTLPLSEVMPARCVQDLLDICEDYARRV